MTRLLATERLPRSARIRLDAATGELRTRRYRMTVLRGPDREQAFFIDAPSVVGQDPAAQVRLSDPTVSRAHLELSPEEHGLRIRDLDSSNGTFIAGALVKEAVVVAATQVSIGATVVELSVEESAIEAPAQLSSGFARVVAESEAMRRVLRMLQRVATVDAPVLLSGETGCGKDTLARALHKASLRRDGPFVVLDCAAISPSLVESELFGHAKGAFTGADREREGIFGAANRGTLLLDEVGELPLDVQTKLLRALESKKVRRVGDELERPIDARIIASTRKDLEREVQAGRFRADLYYRLAVVLVPVPPLRSRPEDLAPLCRALLAEIGASDVELPARARSWMSAHAWPGNVRELRSCLERLAAGQDPSRGAAPSASPSPSDDGALRGLPFKDAKELVVERFTRKYLEELLEQHGGNVAKASEASGLARTYLHHLLRRLGIDAKRGQS